MDPIRPPDLETSNPVIFDNLTIAFHGTFADRKRFTVLVGSGLQPLSGTRLFLQAAATHLAHLAIAHLFTSTGTKRDAEAKIRFHRALSGKGNPGYAIHRVVEPEIDHIES